jgi:hypothetical protein
MTSPQRTSVSATEKTRTLVKTYIKKIATFCLQADHVELPCQIRMKASNITEDEVSNTRRMPA